MDEKQWRSLPNLLVDRPCGEVPWPRGLGAPPADGRSRAVVHPSTLPFLPKQVVSCVRPRPCVSVFDCVDYHVFLRDWIEARRELPPSYSYQALANRAGLKSRSSLRLVVIGEQDLSSEAELLQKVCPRKAVLLKYLVDKNERTF